MKVIRFVGRGFYRSARLERRWLGTPSQKKSREEEGGEDTEGSNRKKNVQGGGLPPGVFLWLMVPIGAIVVTGMKDLKLLWDSLTAPFKVTDIASDISMLNTKYGCAPIFLRLAWQSACLYDKSTETGSLTGCLADSKCIYSKLPCCNGLDRAVQLLAGVKERYDISWPDLIALAGCVAVEDMGGPRVTFRYGRVEKELDVDLQELLAKIPDRNKSVGHLKNVFYKMGFTRSEVVALMGGHTVGGTHKLFTGVEGTWTSTPYVFDNAYFIELLDNDWKFTTRPGEASCYTASNLTMFPIDLALLKDPELLGFVKLFSENEILFHDTFSTAFQKLLEFGFTDLKSSGWVNPGSSQI